MSFNQFSIRISENISEVLPLWRKFEENGASTPFQTRAWLLPLFDTLVRDFKAEPVFVTVYNGDDVPILFLPLCRRRHLGARVIQFPDFGVNDYNAPLISNDWVADHVEIPALLRGIIKALDNVDWLRLDKMPMMVGEFENPLVQLKGIRPIAAKCWGIDIPSNIADYSLMITKTFNKEIKRKLRRVDGKGNIIFSQARTTDDKIEVFRNLVRQRQQRCDEMGRFHLLSDQRFYRFYEAVLVRDETHDFAALHALRVNNELVATTMALRHNNSRLVLMTTFESGKWKSCSLGNVVIYKSIIDSIDRGETYFDLTIGNESYKKDFGAASKPLFALARSTTILGLPHATVRSAVTLYRNFGAPAPTSQSSIEIRA